ncbi:MAG TPA: hypothetical protein DDY70_02235 [Clostridiales bacterium]|nr:hypothetical protein [Clostridiales bacterium]
MPDYFLDFSVTNINTIVERNAEQWAVNKLSFANSCVMVLCLAGKADYVFSDGSTVSSKKDRILFFPPKNIRSGKADPEEPWHFISVNFDVVNLNGNRDVFQSLPGFIDSVPESVRTKFKKLSAVWKEKSYLYKLKCRILTEEILYDLLNLEKSNGDPHSHAREIEAVTDFLQQNFTQKISLEDIGKFHQLSETHFRKLFHQVTGMSVKEYLIKLRLDYAIELLSSGEFNITETADLCGFCDVYYFCSLFKKKYGCSPSKRMQKKR